MKFLACSFILCVFSISLHFNAQAQANDLIGPTTIEQVRTEHRIFDLYTKRYQPNQEDISFLSTYSDSISITVLFGTWCHDSKKQIPAFFKILEEANNPLINTELIAVSRKKKQPESSIKRWGLRYTPTFIIVKGDKEIGRIVEEPSKSMENDLVEILRTELNSGN
jgi:thiol-disulfide isomerase/thioredoxin